FLQSLRGILKRGSPSRTGRSNRKPFRHLALETLEDRTSPTVSSAFSVVSGPVQIANYPAATAQDVTQWPFGQNGASISVNPQQPGNQIATPSFDLKSTSVPDFEHIWYTFDAGQTWKRVAIPQASGTASNPGFLDGFTSVAFSRNGVAVLVHQATH